jgi:phosphoheptose isomerase
MVEQATFYSRLQDAVEDNFAVKTRFIAECGDDFAALVDKIGDVFESGRRLYICGNGGSAGDAQHLATELVVRLDAGQKRDPLPAIALTTDSSILTAAANDFGFDYIFSRQLEALGRPGDGLLILSTSGVSSNLVTAANTAKELRMPVLALLGKTGGDVAELAEFSVIVPSDSTQRIQETHLFCLHLLCELLEERFAPEEEEDENSE